VSENTVAALMRELGLAARRKKGRKATTRPGKGRWRAPDLVKGDFPAAALGDLACGEGECHDRGGLPAVGGDDDPRGSADQCGVRERGGMPVAGRPGSSHHPGGQAPCRR
jgi:hypothetical protein